jgi:hypothetical protein
LNPKPLKEPFRGFKILYTIRPWSFRADTDHDFTTYDAGRNDTGREWFSSLRAAVKVTVSCLVLTSVLILQQLGDSLGKGAFAQVFRGFLWP